MAIFNVGDFVGRLVVAFESVNKRLLMVKQVDVSYARGEASSSDRTTMGTSSSYFTNYNNMVWYLTWIRVVFVPLVVLCVYRYPAKPLVQNDLARSIIILLLGLTNGFIVCANFVVAPEMSKHSKDAASLLVLLSLFFGLATGSYFGIVLEYGIRQIIVERQRRTEQYGVYEKEERENEYDDGADGCYNSALTIH